MSDEIPVRRVGWGLFPLRGETDRLQVAYDAARESQAAMESLSRIMAMDAETIAGWRAVAQSGTIHQPHPDAMPRAMVECTTEYDWAELPDDLRDGLREWCARFKEWAD